jgi:3-isopropylmalate/(R)-2-methylmalate dehydratase small subunit
VIDLEKSKLTNQTTGDSWDLQPLGDVAPILEAGGIFPYAKQAGMIGS